jgi:hypothetical protein
LTKWIKKKRKMVLFVNKERSKPNLKNVKTKLKFEGFFKGAESLSDKFWFSMKNGFENCFVF